MATHASCGDPATKTSCERTGNNQHCQGKSREFEQRIRLPRVEDTQTFGNVFLLPFIFQLSLEMLTPPLLSFRV